MPRRPTLNLWSFTQECVHTGRSCYGSCLDHVQSTPARPPARLWHKEPDLLSSPGHSTRDPNKRPGLGQPLVQRWRTDGTHAAVGCSLSWNSLKGSPSLPQIGQGKAQMQFFIEIGKSIQSNFYLQILERGCNESGPQSPSGTMWSRKGEKRKRKRYWEILRERENKACDSL